MCMLYSSFFFFSSRRRHTRFKCDWSSDVCSSDLFCGLRKVIPASWRQYLIMWWRLSLSLKGSNGGVTLRNTSRCVVWGRPDFKRSEERRVGKECEAWEAAVSEREERGSGENVCVR